MPPLSASLRRTALRLAVVAVVAYGMVKLMALLHRQMQVLEPGDAWMHLSLVALILAAYALLIALPFVPGVEIGLALMAMGGTSLAPAVYAATLAGLYAAFAAGRFLPHRRLRRFLLDLRLQRACEHLDRIAPLTPAERLDLLQARLPGAWGRRLVRWRYLLLALLINMPGSAAIGGGGGICMAAGLSHLFRPAATAATLVLAVLPLPLGVWLWWPGLVSR